MAFNLLLGDCLEVMNEIPDGSVDMILCDLPYGMTACKWDSQINLELLWKQYKRIAKKDAAIILFGINPFSANLIMSNVKHFKYAWSWWKSHPSGFQYAKYRPMQKHEDILVFSYGKPKYFPQMTKGPMKASRSGNPETKREEDTVVGSGVKHNLSIIKNDTYFPTTQLFFKQIARCKSVHPTQKPVELCEYLIRTYSEVGDVVLDNCMGSGTTGVACSNVGRKFIGIEMDKETFSLAKERIELCFI